jgi:thiamine phosphate synthase YjbQ (UPF0047 family)
LADAALITYKSMLGVQPDLGRWRGIYLYEHRARAHERRITLHQFGE